MPSGGVCGVLSFMPRICLAAASARRRVVGQLDAAGLAAAARVDLRLDDDPAAQPLGDRARLGRRVGHLAVRHRHAVLPQDRLAPGTRGSSCERHGTRGRSARSVTWPLAAAACGRPTRSGRSSSAMRSLSGMMALSVIWMCSGQTSVQHLVMLQKPSPACACMSSSAVVGVERVHLERGQPHEEARAGERRLVLLVVADDVADVLAQEALDALVELLDAVDVLLLIRRVPSASGGLGLNGGICLGLLVVVGDVGDQVLDEREGLERRDGDRLARLEGVHPRHAHEPRLAVDLGAARAALARLAVPAARPGRAPGWPGCGG